MGVLIKEQRRLADLGGFEQGTVDQTLPAGSSYSQCKNNHENFLITRVRTINLIKAKNLVINIKSGFLYFLILFDGNKQFQHIASNDWLTESQIEIGNSETEYFAIAIRKSDNSTISTSEVSQALNEVFVITEYPDVKVATSEEEAYTEGRNLLLYSKATPENAKYWTARAFVTIEYGNPPDFFPYYKVRVSSDATMSDSAGIAGSHIGIHSVARLEKGKKYLWHFMCHSDVDYPFGASRVGHIQTRPILESSNPCHVEINMKYSPKTIPANTWTHCMVEFEVTEDAWFVPYLWYLSNNGTLQGKVIRFGQFMLEEGTTAHPYRPAPEDLVGGGTSMTTLARSSTVTLSRVNDGQDAFSIVYDAPNGLEFTSAHRTLTITAKVFKGGVELTDAQINQYGALKWYEVGVAAAIGTGKTIMLDRPREVYATLEN